MKLTKEELINIGVVTFDKKIKRIQPIGREFSKVIKITKILNRRFSRRENKVFDSITFWAFMPYENNRLRKWYIVTESLPILYSDKIVPYKKILGNRVIFTTVYDSRVRNTLSKEFGILI